jgi:hypothetical protein
MTVASPSNSRSGEIFRKDGRFQTNTLFVDSNSASETRSYAARLAPHDSRVTRRASRKYSDKVFISSC